MGTRCSLWKQCFFRVKVLVFNFFTGTNNLSFLKEAFFCSQCKKVVHELEQLLFVENDSPIGFCAESCIEKFYEPHDQCALTVVLAANGYPGSYDKGTEIKGLDGLSSDTVQVFHAGTKAAGRPCACQWRTGPKRDGPWRHGRGSTKARLRGCRFHQMAGRFLPEGYRLA